MDTMLSSEIRWSDLFTRDVPITRKQLALAIEGVIDRLNKAKEQVESDGRMIDTVQLVSTAEYGLSVVELTMAKLSMEAIAKGRLGLTPEQKKDLSKLVVEHLGEDGLNDPEMPPELREAFKRMME